MRSLILPSDAFCFESSGLRLSLCPARSGADVQQRGSELAVHEARANLADGSTRIIVQINHPEALLRAASFCAASPRLIALTWDKAELAKALKADTDSDTLHQARSLIVMTARAAGVLALDSVSPTLSENDLRRVCDEARRNGFDGKLAVDLAQQALIEEAFA